MSSFIYEGNSGSSNLIHSQDCEDKKEVINEPWVLVHMSFPCGQFQAWRFPLLGEPTRHGYYMAQPGSININLGKKSLTPKKIAIKPVKE